MNKEHSIIISTDLIPATLDDRKTQTRRVMKDQPVINETKDKWIFNCKQGVHWWWLNDKPDVAFLRQFCPYGQVGDRLWVRETWAAPINYNDLKPSNIPSWAGCWWKTDKNRPLSEKGLKWRSSRFMPRWASRITLEITGVRIERLQEITYGDCLSEGLDMSDVDYTPGWDVSKFKLLWDSLNAKQGWEINPWVWVIEFRRCINESKK